MASVTPNDGGCLKYIEDFLSARGFETEYLNFGRVKNIWSIKDNGGPLLVFLGHVDVVLQAQLKNGNTTPSLDMMMEITSMAVVLVI